MNSVKSVDLSIVIAINLPEIINNEYSFFLSAYWRI